MATASQARWEAWTTAPFTVALVEGDEPPLDCSGLLCFPFRPFLRGRDLLPRRSAPEVRGTRTGDR